MNISNKDKKLLVYLLALAVVAGSYFFAAKPLLDKQANLTNEISNLQAQVNHCNEIYNNKENYELQTAEAQREYLEIANKFFGGLDQENVIMMLKSLEDSTSVWISRVSFSEAEMMMGSEGEMTEATEESSQETTEGSSEDIALTGLRQDLNIDYSARYEDYKKFIEYVQNYDKRLYISSMSTSYSVDTNKVSGSIVLSQYAIKGIDENYKQPDVQVQTGVDNIFSTLNSTPLAPAAEIQSIEKSDDVNQTENQEAEASDEENNNEQNSDEGDSSKEEQEQNELEDDPNNSGRRKPGA